MRRLDISRAECTAVEDDGLTDSGTHRFVATVVSTRSNNYCTSTAQGNKKGQLNL